MEHGDTNVFILIFAQPFRQLSYLAGIGTSRTLKHRVIGICDKNKVKTTYCDQHRYNFSNLVIIKMRVSWV